MRLQVDSSWCWLQAVSSFLLHAIFFGIAFSFGIFYVALLKDFPGQESEAAWITGINFGVLMLMSPFSIYLLNHFPSRLVCCTGALLASLALYLASKANTMLVLYMTFGVMHGTGSNLCYMSAIWVLRKNFQRHLDFAFGLASAGSGAGGIMFGIMLPTLIESRGWRGAFEVVSYVTLGSVACSMVMKPVQEVHQEKPVARQEKKSLLPWKSKCKEKGPPVPSPWRNRAFLVLSIAVLLCAFVSSVPYCHIVNYAIHQGVRKSQGERLPLFIAIGSLIGRIFVGRASGFRGVSRITLCQVVFLVECLATTLCTLATNTAALVSFSLVFGLCDGAFSTLLAIVVDDVFLDKNQALRALGQLFQMLAIPFALGAPLAGWLYTQTGSYHTAFVFCGGILFIAACLISLVRYLLQPALDTPVLTLPEKVIVSRADDDSGDLVPVQRSISSRLISSRACSFMDLAVEVYGNNYKNEQITSVSSTHLTVYPQIVQIGGLGTRRDLYCSQDFLKAKYSAAIDYEYTDITNQISGLAGTGETSSSTNRNEEHNSDITVFDRQLSDTSSLDDVDNELKHGSSGISIDDAGYYSAPAPANFVDSDTQSLTSQNDVRLSACFQKGSLDSFIEVDLVEVEKFKDYAGYYVTDDDFEYNVMLAQDTISKG